MPEDNKTEWQIKNNTGWHIKLDSGENSLIIPPSSEDVLPVGDSQSHIISISEDKHIIKNNTRWHIKYDVGENSRTIPPLAKRQSV